MINANLRKLTKENSASTNKKNTHQRFFVCLFEKKLRVKILSSEHLCHNDNEHFALTAQKNHNEFNIVNRDLADRSLFERKKKTRTNRQTQDRKSI